MRVSLRLSLRNRSGGDTNMNTFSGVQRDMLRLDIESPA